MTMAHQFADPLASYRTKRDFTRTPEPAPLLDTQPAGHRFIVQKHDATRLHWDFRIEVDGVMKSWAVTKGPSSDPAVKRLAVRTEDHPLSYADFEGTIPAGEYGGGTVMLWDSGTWAPLPGKSADDLDAGHLHFILHGTRMQGEWMLIRLKPRPREKRENWLLRKIADGHEAGPDVLTDRCLTSVLTGRSMAEIAADRQGNPARAGIRHRKPANAAPQLAQPAKPASRAKNNTLPKFQAPQLATLVDAVPAGNGWMHEIKFDGYRALVAVAGSQLRVYTRNGLDWTDKFGPLAKALAALDQPPCLIDAEITAPGPDGNPSFSALQAVLKRGHGAQNSAQHLDLHAFDLLSLGGKDLRKLPNIERKERLEALLKSAVSPIHVADHVIGAGEKLFAAICQAGQEGIIAKRIDAPYRAGRTHDWVKVKCTRRQEFVIVGWSRSQARGRPFAALLLAQHEAGELTYRGKVGTGFDAATLDDLAARMAPLALDQPPLATAPVETRGAHWIRPELVAEVAFAELTSENRVRHGSFLGLRADKPARDVAPEVPRAAPRAEAPVHITSRERVIYPGSGQTKGDLADYYAAIAPLLLAHAAQRPVSLVRCPQGRAKACFFQKHDTGALGDHVRHIPIREKDGSSEDYLYVEDQIGILQCVQMGTFEFHGWASRVADVEKPDRLIFDLDPDEGLGFPAVKKAAIDLRTRLADLGLASFAMLSGGKGVHVIVPLATGHSWAAHTDFAHRFAEALSMAEPDRFLATMSKATRKGKIFIDWLRNQRGATAVVPYSARARDGAPVAAPVSWDELAEIDTPARWTIADSDELIARARMGALIGWGFAEQALPEL